MTLGVEEMATVPCRTSQPSETLDAWKTATECRDSNATHSHCTLQ